MNWILYVIASIISIIIILIILSSEDTNLLTKIVLSLLIPIITFFTFNGIYKFSKEEDKKLEGINLLEYTESRKIEPEMPLKEIFKKSGIDRNNAYTITKVNLRSGPSVEYQSLEILPEDTKVNLNLILSYKDYAPQTGDWFKVGVNGKTGWVNGKYLRPVRKSEIFKSFLPNLRWTWNLIFPEKTLLGKIIGVLIAIPLSLVFDILLMYIFGFSEEVYIFNIEINRSVLSIVMPLSYFLIKSNYFITISAEEHLIIFPFLIMMSILSSLPTIFLSEIIEDLLN